MTAQDSPLARKLGAYLSLSKAELTVLESFHGERRSFPGGKELIHEGQPAPSAFVLFEGWASSFKVLRDGGRQIVDFQIPGDFLGLSNVLLRKSDHCIESITDIKASQFDAADLFGAIETCPRIASAVLWAASSDEAAAVERLVSLGRRDALERMAHFLLELGARLKQVGLATRQSYACPLSQYHLADALGLSPVHVNRVLRQLREDGLLTFRNGRVVFDDFDRLVTLCDFDMAYLDYEGPVLKTSNWEARKGTKTEATPQGGTERI